MATAATVTIEVVRIKPADSRQRESILPAGSTTKTLLSAIASHPSSPTTVNPATVYADTDTIAMTFTGTQADLKVLGL